MPLIKLCCAALAETDRVKRQKLLHRIFDGYNASSDVPGMAFVDDLCEMYPDMKVVLNLRESPEAWARSANDSIRFFGSLTYLIICGLVPRCYWHWRLHHEYRKVARRKFGEGIDTWSTEYYEMHNAWVRRVVKEKTEREVLEWEAGMGWERLCGELGVGVPQQAFPKSNEGKEVARLKPIILFVGLASWAGLIAVVAGGWYFISRWLL